MEEITDVSQTQTYLQKVYGMIIEYAPSFLLAIVVLLIGLRIFNLSPVFSKKI